MDQLKKDNNSETLDMLTTESDVEPDHVKKTGNIFKSKICKGCDAIGSLIEDEHSSVLVCKKCGIVNEELLDHGPEWRQYNNDDNRGDTVGRCGCPSNFFFPKSTQGTIMSGSSNSRLKRKQTWNSTVYKERTLNH